MDKPDYTEELRFLAQDHERDFANSGDEDDEEEWLEEEEDDDEGEEEGEPTEEEEEEADFAGFLKDVAAEMEAKAPPAQSDPGDPGDILSQLVARAKAAAPTVKGRKAKTWGKPASSDGSFTYQPTDYTSTAYVLMVVEIECRHCGTIHKSSNGIFLEQRHKTRDESTLKRVEPASLTTGLPRRRETRSMQVEVCLTCAPTFGF